MKTWKKTLLGCLAVVLALVIALGVTVWCLWGNELATLASISQVRARNDAHLDGSVYTMQVKGGF